MRRVLDVDDGGAGGGGEGAGGDLRLGVDGFRLCADLLCRMSRQYQVISALDCNTSNTTLSQVTCYNATDVSW